MRKDGRTILFQSEDDGVDWEILTSMLRSLMPSPNMSRLHNVLIDKYFFLSSYVILFSEAQPGYQVVRPPPLTLSLNSDIYALTVHLSHVFNISQRQNSWMYRWRCTRRRHRVVHRVSRCQTSTGTLWLKPAI